MVTVGHEHGVSGGGGEGGYLPFSSRTRWDGTKKTRPRRVEFAKSTYSDIGNFRKVPLKQEKINARPSTTAGSELRSAVQNTRPAPQQVDRFADVGLVRGVLESDHAKAGVFGEDREANRQRFGRAVLITVFHRMCYQALALRPSPYRYRYPPHRVKPAPFTTSMDDNRPGNRSTVSHIAKIGSRFWVITSCS